MTHAIRADQGGPPTPPDPLGSIGSAAGETDRGWARGLATQLVVVVLSVGAVNAVRPIVTYRALGLGAGPLEIGLVQSAFSILPAMTAVAIGRWVDERGEARFLAGAMAILAVACLVTAAADSLLVLAAAMTLLGLGQIMSHVAGQTMIANRGPREGRELRYGWYATCASLGQLIGPAAAALVLGAGVAAAAPSAGNASPVAGFGPALNPQAPVFVLGAGMAIVALGLALTIPHRRPRPRRSGEAAPPVGLARAAWLVLRRPGMPAAMLVSITVLSSVDVLVAYLPAYGEAVGLPVETVGLLLAVRAGASLASRLGMGALIARLGRERLLAGSMVLAALGIGALVIVPPTPVLVGCLAAAGLGLGLGQPMTIAWVANRSPRHERALALGVRLTGNRASLLVVPTAVGALAGTAGLSSIWLAVAVVLALGAAAATRTSFDRATTDGGAVPERSRP